MQNIFYQRDINLVFDLKGSTRSRYVRNQDSVPIGVSSRSSNNVTMPSVATSAPTAAAAAGGDPSTEAAMISVASAGGNGGVGALGANMGGRGGEGGVAGAALAPSVTVASSVTGWDDSASDAPTESSTWRGERASTEGKTNPKPTPVRAE